MSENVETAVKIVCPVCKQNFCYEDDYKGGGKGYLCYNCGATSNSKMVPDSEYLEKAMLASPDLINDTKFLDVDRNIVWFLSTIRTTDGIIFPEPKVNVGWEWTVAKIVDIDEDKQADYPIPGRDGEFYTNRLAIEQAKSFAKHNFYDACQELGGIVNPKPE